MIYLPFIVLSLVAYSRFLKWNETRSGNVIRDDPVMTVMPRRDMSDRIVLLEVTGAAVALKDLVIQHGFIGAEFFFLQYCVVNFFKTFSLLILPLEPPADTVGLADAITDSFVGKRLVKDLFFSGHTAFMALCLFNSDSKAIMSLSVVLMGVMLIMTRTHFTIDVYIAPFMAFCAHSVVMAFSSVLQRADESVLAALEQTWT